MAQTKAQLVVGLNVNASAPASALQIDASGNVNLDSNTLYVDATNNRVGVGTTSPSGLLSVHEPTASTANYINITNAATGASSWSNGLIIGVSTSGAGLCWQNENLDFLFGTNNTERLRITSDGKVGIGTSSPAALLEASSATGSATPTPTEIRLSSTTNAADWSTTDPWARVGFYSADTTGGARLRGAIDTIQTFSNGNVSSLAFKLDDASTGLVERMRVTYDGKVGIGVTSPGKRLELSDGTVTGGLDPFAGGSSFTLGTSTNHSLRFDVNSAERARIDTSGRLLVGTSSSSHPAKFITQGNATGGNFASMAIAYNSAASAVSAGTTLGEIDFTDQSAGGVFARIRCAGDGTGGTNDYPGRLEFSTTADGASSPTERMRINSFGQSFHFSADTTHTAAISQTAGTSYALYRGRYSATGTTDGTQSFVVWSNGNVQNTNNSYTAISDIKLKENIADAGSQWADLKALRVRNYNLKEGQTHRQIGLIAQEVELVSPGLVYETPDRDDEGNDLGTVTKSVNYSVLYMKAVKALQEAMERIEDLEARLDAANL